MSTEAQRDLIKAETNLRVAIRNGKPTGALYARYVELGGLVSWDDIAAEEAAHPEKKRKVVKVVKS